MTSHLNSHGTTDIKPEMLSGVQTGYGTPHDKYNVSGIELYIYIGVEARDLYINEAHTALDIFRFAAFFYRFFL